MKFAIVVPARKGSKGIKNKNMQLINGEPLYIRAINQGARVTGKCIINTDIDEILNSINAIRNMLKTLHK